MASASRPSKARCATSASWRSRPIGPVVGAVGERALEPAAVELDRDLRRGRSPASSRRLLGRGRATPSAGGAAISSKNGGQLGRRSRSRCSCHRRTCGHGRAGPAPAPGRSGTSSSRPVIASSRSASGAWSRANSRNRPSPTVSRAVERRSQMRMDVGVEDRAPDVVELEVALEAGRRRQRRPGRCASIGGQVRAVGGQLGRGRASRPPSPSSSSSVVQAEGGRQRPGWSRDEPAEARLDEVVERVVERVRARRRARGAARTVVASVWVTVRWRRPSGRRRPTACVGSRRVGSGGGADGAAASGRASRRSAARVALDRPCRCRPAATSVVGRGADLAVRISTISTPRARERGEEGGPVAARP